MVRADWLFLLTDVPCLYTANPSTDPNAEPIHEVRDIAALQVSLFIFPSHQSLWTLSVSSCCDQLTVFRQIHLTVRRHTHPGRHEVLDALSPRTTPHPICRVGAPC